MGHGYDPVGGICRLCIGSGLVGIGSEREGKKTTDPAKCKYCKEPATKGIMWAEGMGRVPCCDKHLEEGLAAIKEEYGKPDSVRDLRKSAAKNECQVCGEDMGEEQDVCPFCLNGANEDTIQYLFEASLIQPREYAPTPSVQGGRSDSRVGPGGPKGSLPLPRGHLAQFNPGSGSAYDPVRDVSPSSKSPGTSDQTGVRLGDPWVDLGDNGTAPQRPGYLKKDRKLKRWINDEQETWPEEGPPAGGGGPFPGAGSDVNKLGAEEPSGWAIQKAKEQLPPGTPLAVVWNRARYIEMPPDVRRLPKQSAKIVPCICQTIAPADHGHDFDIPILSILTHMTADHHSLLGTHPMDQLKDVGQILNLMAAVPDVHEISHGVEPRSLCHACKGSGLLAVGYEASNRPGVPPQEPGQWQADNGIEDPAKDSVGYKLRKILPKSQEGWPTNNTDLNVSIDNQNKVGAWRSPRITFVQGDITKQGTDAIVNAANEALLGGGGVDGAIHAAAGPSVMAECRKIRETTHPDGLIAGEAVTTGAGDLPSKYIIHTVGPRYDSHPDPERALRECHVNALKEADRVGARNVSFPAISTGVFGYPVEDAAKVAVDAVRNAKTNVREVRFVSFDDKTHGTFSKQADLLSQPTQEQTSDMAMHLVRTHGFPPELVTDGESFNSAELEELHMEDHLEGRNDHLPETLRVASEE